MSYRPTDWDVLDLPADPTPGDGDDVLGLARRLQWVSDEASASARGVRSLAGDQAVLEWVGAAADVFRPAIGDLPGQLDKLDRSYSLAADALSAFASSLAAAQAQADRALDNGRAARRDLDSMRASLSAAQSGLTTAASGAERLTSPAASAPPPDPADVRAAVGRRVAAQQHVDSLSGQVGDAQHRLDLAKRLAQQAGELRDDAADVAARRIDDAADAGIPPDSFWHKLGDALKQTWDVIITVAKVVVIIGSIVALIVGGPIAWIVVAAALLVLLDTLIKKSQGKASWFDVGMALLNCIPVTRGLTTIGALKSAFTGVGEAATTLKFAGMLGVGEHLGLQGRAAFGAAKDGLGALWTGRKALPVLLYGAPSTALGRLSSMTTALRFQVPASWTAFGLGVTEGSGIFGRMSDGAVGAYRGWRAGDEAFETAVRAGDLPAVLARRWQSGATYPVADLWHDATLTEGTRLEALSPGYSGFVTSEGTMSQLGNDSTRISEALQAAPSEIGGPIVTNYRPEGVVLHMQTDVSAASATTHANIQYGGGGATQHFIPNFTDRVLGGDVTVHGLDGSLLATRLDNGRLVADTGGGQVIALHNLDLAAGTSTSTGVAFAKHGLPALDGVRTVSAATGHFYNGYRATYEAAEVAP